MNTNDIWIALAINGRTKISSNTLRDFGGPCGTHLLLASGEEWMRIQLNAEAQLEGVSLRINSVMKGDYFQGLDISLRKFT